MEYISQQLAELCSTALATEPSQSGLDQRRNSNHPFFTVKPMLIIEQTEDAPEVIERHLKKFRDYSPS